MPCRRKPSDSTEITDDRGSDLDKCAEGSLLYREEPRDAGTDMDVDTDTDTDLDMALRTDRHARMQQLSVMLEDGTSCVRGTQIAEQVKYQCPHSSDRSDASLPLAWHLARLL